MSQRQRIEPTFGQPTQANEAQPIEQTATPTVEADTADTSSKNATQAAPKSIVMPSINTSRFNGKNMQWGVFNDTNGMSVPHTPLHSANLHLNARAENPTPNVSESAAVKVTAETTASSAPNVSAVKAENPTVTAAAASTATPVGSEKVTSASAPEAAKVFAAERVVADKPLQRETDSTPSQHTQENEKMPKISSKARRLGLIALVLLLILALLYILKPSAKNDEAAGAIPAQGNNLPIEFRPVDEEEAKAVEAREAALAAQQAQQQAEAAAQAQAQQQAQQAQQAAQPQTTVGNNVIENAPASDVEVIVPSAKELMKEEAQSVQPAAPAQTHAQAPVVLKPVTPRQQGSVVYQEERPSKPESKVKTAEKPKSEPVKAPTKEVTKPLSQQEKMAERNTQMNRFVEKLVAEDQPAGANAVASKKLTVRKGVSLMQVFRENNLNISDVNAMDKANKAVSRLRENETVSVQLDANNRVVEMRLGSGGRYIRQANGSYIYR